MDYKFRMGRQIFALYFKKAKQLTFLGLFHFVSRAYFFISSIVTLAKNIKSLKTNDLQTIFFKDC